MIHGVTTDFASRRILIRERRHDMPIINIRNLWSYANEGSQRDFCSAFKNNTLAKVRKLSTFDWI